MKCVKWGEVSIETRTEDTRFDHVLVTDEILGELLTGAPRASIKKIRDAIRTGNIADEFATVMQTPGIMRNPLFENLDPQGENAGYLLRVRALAFQSFKDSLTEQSHIINRLKLQTQRSGKNKGQPVIDDKTELLLIDAETGLPKVSSLTLHASLGKKLAKSLGLVVKSTVDPETGKRHRPSKKDVHEAYVNLGKSAMKELVKSGAVKAFEGEVTIANNKIKTNDLEFIADPTISAKGISYTINTDAFEITADNRAKAVDMLIGNGANDHSKLFKDLNKSLKSSRVIQAVVTKRNYKAPTAYAEPDMNDGGVAGKVVKEKKELMARMNAIPIIVQPYFINMLTEIRDKIVNSGKDPLKDSYKTVIAELVKDIPGTTMENYKELFFIDSKKITDSVDPKKEISRQISSSNSMKLLLENVESLLETIEAGDGKMYTDHVVVRNNRLTNLLTVLNAQFDSKLSRALLGTDPYEIKIFQSKNGDVTEDYIRFLVDLQENYGVTPEILNLPEMRDILYKYGAIMSDPTVEDPILKMIGQLSITDLPIKSKSVYDTLNAIDALYNLDKALANNDTKFTTTYLAGPDATASGGMIMLLQNIDNKLVQDILIKMGMLPDKNGKLKKLSDEDIVKDVYAILEKPMIEYLNEPIKKGSFSDISYDMKKKKYDRGEALRSLIGEGKPYKNLRDLLKQPIMTFLYGQSTENNKSTLGEAITKELFDTYNTRELRELADKLGLEITDEDITNSAEAARAFINYYTENVGNVVVDEMTTHFEKGMFKEHNEFIDGIVNEMVDLVDSGVIRATNIRLLDPYTYIKLQERFGDKYDYSKARLFGLPMTKSFQVLSEDGQSIMSKEGMNPASYKVIVQHMIDSAVLMLTYEDYLDTLEEGEIPESSAHIHDQIKGSVPFTKLIEKLYRKNLKKVSALYDYREQLLEELQYSYGRRPDKYKLELADVKERLAENEKRKENKRALLDTMADVNRTFGNDANLDYSIADFEYLGDKVVTDQQTIEENMEETSYDRRYRIAQDILDKTKDGWIVLDTETTGLDSVDTVIEFGYVDNEGNKEAFLIEPKADKKRLDLLKRNMLGIESDSVRRLTEEQFDKLVAGNKIDGIPVISVDEAVSKINKLIGTKGKAIVAHNAPFDVKMLQNLGVDTSLLKDNVIDTAKLSKDYHENETNKLESYVKELTGEDMSSNEKQHTALYDSEQTANAFTKTLEFMDSTVKGTEEHIEANLDGVFDENEGCGV